MDDLSDMVWTGNVGAPSQFFESDFKMEENSLIAKKIEEGWLLGPPKPTRYYSVEELNRREMMGLYRPKNWFEKLLSRVFGKK